MPDHLPGHGHGVPPTLMEIDGQEVAVVAVDDALISPDTIICLDCGGRAGPSCSDLFGHGVAALGDLMDAYSNPQPASRDSQQTGDPS